MNISLILAQLWPFGMSVIKLSVTLIRQIYNNCILFGQNTGKILSLESETKKDTK